MRLAGLILLLLPTPALAHKLTVQVTPHGDRLRVVACYDWDDPADGATAVLTDATGAKVARATLDAAGSGDLPRPPGEWVVTVDDGAGHRATARSDHRGVGDRPNRWLTLAAGLALIGGWARWRMRSPS